jgi:2-keto-3-deoxy-L-rhamnonate aldolase RhmA
MYITNDKRVAATAEKCGVDWIFIDLEVIGKNERQGHLDTVISNHKIQDISKIKEVIHKSKLLVRINPIYEGSNEEIEQVINEGAELIMLPYFKKVEEVDYFLKKVNRRTKTCLLCETAEAVNQIDEILKLPGIDCIFIGLNDLHLSYHMNFMFEPLADGTVERLCNKFKKLGIPYGFGGIAGLGHGDLSAEYIIAEHYRLGSSMVILSRSFYNATKNLDMKEADEIFYKGLLEIREFEASIVNKEAEFFEENHLVVQKKVEYIASNIAKKRNKQ